MPKSAKHKAARAADFAKAKLKLGKGKQLANNATNTNITSRSIALPQQSLADPNLLGTGIPVSRRNHTLPSLLVQTRHYSAGVKKEALVEMGQMLDAHPFLLQQHLLPLVSSLSHLIADPSQPVRLQTRLLLRNTVFDRLDPSKIAGVSRGLALFTLSALSSLEEAIRLDALKVLDLLLDKIPSEITRGWEYGMSVLDDEPSSSSAEHQDGSGKGDLQDRGLGAKVVQALLGVLRIRSRSLNAANGTFTSAAASSDLTPSSRLAVLNTLSTFLNHALSPVASTSTAIAPIPWYLASSFSSPRSYANFLAATSPRGAPSIDAAAYERASHSVTATLEASRRSTPLAFAPPDEDLLLSSLGLPSLNASSVTFTANSHAPSSASLLSLLHPTLLSSFLDAAPSAFSPTSTSFSSSSMSTSGSGASSGGISADLATVLAVASTAQSLYWEELATSSSASPSPNSNSDSNSNSTEARKHLFTFLTHAAAYFPFSAGSLSPSSSSSSSETSRGNNAQVTETLMRLNLVFASLVSLLVLDRRRQSIHSTSASASSLVGRGGKRQKTATRQKRDDDKDRKIELLVERVRDWVGMALRGQLKTVSHPLGAPLSAQAYTSLEPTLWSLMNVPSSPRQRDDVELDPADELFRAVLVNFERASAGSETKLRGFEFVKRVLLIQSDPSYVNRFTLPDDTSVDSPAGRFVLQQVPKYLWQLGDKQPDVSDSILSFLITLVQQSQSPHPHQASSSSGLFTPSTLVQNLCPTLAPFFSIVVTGQQIQKTKSKSKTKTKIETGTTTTTSEKKQKQDQDQDQDQDHDKVICGPFIHLPTSVQHKAIDLASVLVGLAAAAAAAAPAGLDETTTTRTRTSEDGSRDGGHVATTMAAAGRMEMAVERALGKLASGSGSGSGSGLGVRLRWTMSRG